MASETKRQRDLTEYRAKRDFKKTPEPTGDEKVAPSGDARFFSVQKHLASHLHYDLRLEHKGVLLSWAIPKGPALDTREKRLAMQTEDHPYAYGTFEGVIPEGYGAGIVMLWDQGTWEPESPDVDAALKKGDLKFRLNGYKLKGSWVLVRTRGWGGGGGDSSRSWLLIKHKDDWAGPVDITTFAPLSVKSGGDFENILAAGNPAVWHTNRPAKGGATGEMLATIIERAARLKAGGTSRPEVSAGSRGSSGSKGSKGSSGSEVSSRAKGSGASKAKRSASAKPPTTSRAKKR